MPTHVGMYLNGATSGKMEYYLDYVGGVRSVSCTDVGQCRRFQARLRLRSNAPRDVSGLPDYIIGQRQPRRQGIDARPLYIYGPAGGRIVGIVANGKQRHLILFRATADRPVAFQNLVLKTPGHRSTSLRRSRPRPVRTG